MTANGDYNTVYSISAAQCGAIRVQTACRLPVGRYICWSVSCL